MPLVCYDVRRTGVTYRMSHMRVMAVYRPKCATVLQCYDARTTSIPSQCTCVVDRENLRHLASLRLSCMRTFSYLCRSYPCPGSIAMIAFRHPSRFWASFGSSSCCFRSLRTRSIHLSLGRPRGLPPSSLLHVLLRSFLLFSSHGQTTKGVSGRHTW